MNSRGNLKIAGLFCFLLGIIALIVYLTEQPIPQNGRSTSRQNLVLPTQQNLLANVRISIPTPSSYTEGSGVVTAAIQSTPLPSETPAVAEDAPLWLPAGALGTIQGCVIDDASYPLHLAEVQLQKKYGAGLIAISTDTAQKGYFSFPDLQPAIYQLTARHHSCAITRNSVQQVELNHSTEFVTITLPRLRYGIRGLVREKESMKAVVGQTVVCVKEYSRLNHKNFRFPEDITYRTQSDSEGRFNFPSIIPGTYLITFESIDSATSPYTIANSNANGGEYFGPPPGRVVTVVDRDMEDVLIETAAFPGITGTVRNEAGELIEGASISADFYGYRQSNVTVQTNSLGIYKYPITVMNNVGVSAPLILKAYHPDYGGSNHKIEGIETGTVKDHVDFILKKGTGKLYGTVTMDGQSLKEGDNVEVHVRDLYREIQLSLDASQSTYQINNVEIGESATIWAKAKNTPDVHYDVQLTPETPEKRLDIDLKSLGSLSISGKVNDRNGNPMESVMVIAKQWNIIQNKTETNASGFYQFDELQEGNYNLTFMDQGENHLEGGLYGIPAGSQDVNMILDGDPWRVSGRVFYEDGKPLLGNLFLDLHRTDNPIDTIFYPETRDDGAYSFALYQPGIYLLSKCVKKQLAIKQFTIEPDTSKEIQLDLIFSNGTPLTVVYGHYYEKENTPVERFTYYLSGDPSQRFYPLLGNTGWNGDFVLSAEPGEYLLHLNSPHLPPLDIPVVIERDISFEDKDCLMVYQPGLNP